MTMADYYTTLIKRCMGLSNEDGEYVGLALDQVKTIEECASYFVHCFGYQHAHGLKFRDGSFYNPMTLSGV